MRQLAAGVPEVVFTSAIPARAHAGTDLLFRHSADNLGGF
jgi:hypothetical protein